MLSALWKEDLLETYMDYFNKDLKRFRRSRILIASMFFLLVMGGLLVLVSLGTMDSKGLLMSPIAFYIAYKLPYWKLISQKSANDMILSYVFPDFLQSFIGLLPSSANIYEALNNTAPYTREPLRKEVLNLVKKIEQGNDRNDYIALAEFVGGTEAYMIMDMIYQFSEFGIKKDALQGLRTYVENLQQNRVNELIETSLLKAEIWGHFPILISLVMVLGFVAVIFVYYMQDINDILSFM